MFSMVQIISNDDLVSVSLKRLTRFGYEQGLIGFKLINRHVSNE